MNSKTMTVRIEKTHNNACWYRERLGEVFEVENKPDMALCYWCDKEKGFIDKSDCTPVTPTIPAEEQSLPKQTSMNNVAVRMNSVQEASKLSKLLRYDIDYSPLKRYHSILTAESLDKERVEQLEYDIMSLDQFIAANTAAPEEKDYKAAAKGSIGLLQKVGLFPQPVPGMKEKTKITALSKSDNGLIDEILSELPPPTIQDFIFEALMDYHNEKDNKIEIPEDSYDVLCDKLEDISERYSRLRVEQEAKEFAEWCIENGWLWLIHDKRWYQGGNSKYVTTSDLYQLFKSKNGKG